MNRLECMQINYSMRGRESWKLQDCRNSENENYGPKTEPTAVTFLQILQFCNSVHFLPSDARMSTFFIGRSGFGAWTEINVS